MNLTVMRDGSERIGYENPAVPFYIRRGDLKSLSNMSALCHWHEDVEFLLPIKGYLTYYVDGVRVTVREGNAIFVNSRCMHYGFSRDGTDCEYLCITFCPQLLGTCEELYGRYVLPLLTNPGLTHRVLRQSIEEHRPVIQLLRRMEGVHLQREPGYELQLLSLLYQLWQKLFALNEDQTCGEYSRNPNVQIQRRMLGFIRTHYSERITVDAIAGAGGVCRTKCCQIFRQYLGVSPNEYLNSFRLEKGTELLKSTDMTITEIAGLCGYGSPSYFTEMFTRHKGCSPKAYRKNG